MSTVLADYRRIRGGWGLALAALWMAYWSVTLGAQHTAAIAALKKCDGFIGGIGCSFSHGAADTKFAFGVFGALLVSPCAWWIAHYIARWRVTQLVRTEEEVNDRQRTEQQAAQRRDSDARLALVTQDAERARCQIERSDFMHKLGAVTDFLNLLAPESDPSRIANMRLGVAQALRDLTAKHTIDQLAALVRADDAVKLSVSTTLRRLGDADFDDTAEVHILKAAMLSGQVARPYQPVSA